MGNLYSQHGFNEAAVRWKEKSISQLARSLRERLESVGTEAEVVRTVVDWIQVEADQLCLSVDGGAPWKTVKTELAIYNLLHSDASWTHRAFKYATLLPALFVAPQFYYGVRRRLAGSEMYVKARRAFLPAPEPAHVSRYGTTRL